MEVLTKLFDTALQEYGLIGGTALACVGGFFWFIFRVVKHLEKLSKNHREERAADLKTHYEKLEKMEERHREERDKDQNALLTVIKENSQESKNLASAMKGLEDWLKTSMVARR